MTDTQSDGEEIPATETDWMAASVQGYGYGYSKEQALLAMARHTRPDDARDPMEVVLVEHVGNASTSAMSWEVETFVSGERVEIPTQTMHDLKRHATMATREAEIALETVDSEEITEE